MGAKILLFILVFCNLLLLSFPVYASNIKINEILVHPSSGNKEWVEFYNPEKTDISKYWIDDDTDFTSDSGNSSKKSLKDLLGMDTNYPYIELSSSMFNNAGDHVVLFDESGTIIDQYEYTKDPGSDVSIGRSPDGSDNFVLLTSATKGSANSAPQPTPTPKPTSTASTKSTTTSIPTTKIIAVQMPLEKSFSSNSLSSLAPIVSSEPTSSSATVLGVNTTITKTPSPTPKTLVKAERQNKLFPLQVLFIGAGVLLLTACGILFFQKWKKTKTVEA